MKKLPVIFTAAFVNGVAANAIQYTMIFSAKQDFATGSGHVGALCATLNIFYVLFCILGRKVLCSLPAITCLKISIAGLFAGTLAMALAPAIWMLYVGIAIIGSATAFYWPPLMGWLSEGYEGKKLAKISGLYNLCWSSGSIVSPIVGGWLCDKSPSLAFWVMLATYFALFIFLASVCPKAQSVAPTAPKAETISGYATTLRYPAWFGLAVCWFCVTYISFIYPYAAEQLYGFSRTKIGFIISFRVVAMTVAVVLIGFLSFWQYKLKWLVLSHLLLAGTMLALGHLQNELLLCIAMALVGVLTGLGYLSSQFHGVAGSTNRTLRMSIHENVISGGYISSGFICGSLYQHTSQATVSAVCAGMVGLALLVDLVYWLFRNKLKA